MSYQFAGIDAALAAAVGEDSALMAELHSAFTDSASHLADLLFRSRCDANWYATAHRLEGLAASFGAEDLLEASRLAIVSAPGDPVALRRVLDEVARLSP